MNVPGSNDPTKPSEGWRGRDVNDSLRAGYSALRNLGDISAKLPLNSDTSINYGPNSGQLGTAAFQNVESFQITGGILGSNVRGSVGFGVILPVICPFVEVHIVYQDMRTRGFELCDGRTANNPYPPFNPVTMPNLRGTYLWMVETDNQIDQGHFLDANHIITVGDHSHAITSTTLGYEHLPAVVTAITPVDSGGPLDQGSAKTVVPTIQGSGLGHTHGMVPTGGHAFSVNVRPPAIGCWFFKRVW